MSGFEDMWVMRLTELTEMSELPILMVCSSALHLLIPVNIVTPLRCPFQIIVE